MQLDETTDLTASPAESKLHRLELQRLSSLTDEEDSLDDAEHAHLNDPPHDHPPKIGSSTSNPSPSPARHANAPSHTPATRTSTRVATRTRRLSTSSHGAHSDSSSDSYHTSRSHTHDSAGTKRRWTADEDARLVALLQEVPALPWPAIAGHLPGRSEGSCVSRWQNHLSRVVRQSERDAGRKASGIASAHSHGKLNTASRRRWSEEEDAELVGLAMSHPALSWEEVAERMEGRSTASCMGKFSLLEGQTGVHQADEI